ncbi:MAG: non-heme iron oxygenase ferredoxin subunit [Gammaproteobacteria bacterium]
MAGWFDVAPESELGPGQSRLVNIDTIMVAVFNLDGDFYAIEDICSHDGSPMLGCGLKQDDLVYGDQIVCPRHGARFSIRTGEALTPPAYEPVTTFPVRIENGMVQICDDHRD